MFIIFIDTDPLQICVWKSTLFATNVHTTKRVWLTFCKNWILFYIWAFLITFTIKIDELANRLNFKDIKFILVLSHTSQDKVFFVSCLLLNLYCRCRHLSRTTSAILEIPSAVEWSWSHRSLRRTKKTPTRNIFLEYAYNWSIRIICNFYSSSKLIIIFKAYSTYRNLKITNWIQSNKITNSGESILIIYFWIWKSPQRIRQEGWDPKHFSFPSTSYFHSLLITTLLRKYKIYIYIVQKLWYHSLIAENFLFYKL